MKRCDTCGAPIFWSATISGKKMPIDAEPTPEGLLVILPPKDDLPKSLGTAVDFRVGTDAVNKMLAEGCPRWTSHFATCPDAQEHRRK